MKLYSSFLLRCWVIRDEAEPKIVFDIEHIQNGEHRRAATADEAMAWILAACQTSQPKPREEIEPEGE